MRNLTYALRSLRRQPAFTFITMLTLALGIGANTAVFSVINGVLLRPLPYPQPDRLELITSQFPGLGFNQFWMSVPEFVEFRDHNQAFSPVGAYSVGAANLDTTPPSRPVGALVTPELMPTLGVQPHRGRWFTAGDSGSTSGAPWCPQDTSRRRRTRRAPGPRQAPAGSGCDPGWSWRKSPWRSRWWSVTRVDAGFNRSGLTTFALVLPAVKYRPDQTVTFYNELQARLASVSGVQSVTAMNGLPLLRNVNVNDTDFEHIPNNRPPGSTPIENVDFWQFTSVGYAETMGIPVVKGRSFELADTQGAPVVLVNEALVRKFFVDRDPIGARIKPGGGPNVPFFTVVGVLKDVKQGGVAEAAGTELYMLTDQVPRFTQNAPRQMNFVMRSTLPLEALASSYRSTVASLDPSLPLVRLQSMDDAFAAAIERPRFLTLLLAVFAGLALALAAVGTYGILSYLVSLRTQEIGIRMALGADRSRILRLVLTRGLVLTGLGLVLGLAASLAATRVLSSLLFNVEPTDLATLAPVAGVMIAVSLAACLVPALRATRVDPLVVMRDS